MSKVYTEEQVKEIIEKLRKLFYIDDCCEFIYRCPSIEELNCSCLLTESEEQCCDCCNKWFFEKIFKEITE